jgi:hypothetical protein
MKRKERQAEALYSGIIRGMGKYQQREDKGSNGKMDMELPAWL